MLLSETAFFRDGILLWLIIMHLVNLEVIYTNICGFNCEKVEESFLLLLQSMHIIMYQQPPTSFCSEAH